MTPSVADWNIVTWFNSVAERFPNSPAIEQGSRRVTYLELSALTDRLARRLISKGSARESLVAILTEDAIATIVAIIGILKAGGAFVPFDPRTPPQRLLELLSEAPPAYFVTESGLSSLVNQLSQELPGGLTVIRIDDETEPATSRLTRVAVSNAGLQREPDGLCYVYFTSGSTGRPKGIAGRFKSIAHFTQWEIETLGLEPGCRVSQLTSPSFDAVLRDVFSPLCAGGVICVPDDLETMLDANRLADWIDRAAVEVIHCTPSMFRSLLSLDLSASRFSSLRYVLLAGETVFPSDVGKWTRVFGDRVQLINLYGPSETTMTKFVHFIKPSDAEAIEVPIGRPMKEAKAVLVDQSGNICPPGAVGEIYIKTPYRSRGYYRRPDLTGESFIQNPFGNDPDDIVYKTGDLARMTEDGNLVFLGRRDDQVKIRGVRVELGEVENALRRCEDVADAAVIDQEDTSGFKYLCAYVVTKNGSGEKQLRQHLSYYLPESMIPSAITILDALPRTLNGKLDRKALPLLTPGRDRRASEPVAPRTPVETDLLKIWERLLPVQGFGVHDSFFEIGGHSLLATQVMSRVRVEFGVELKLRELFVFPTIAGLAERIEEALLTNVLNDQAFEKSLGE